MNEKNLVEPFEASRAHLRSVAYRMLGSLSEADDAVQEAWIRVSRAESDDVENVRGWLTTVVARVCLDMLRSRKSRREEVAGEVPEPPTTQAAGAQEELELANSVGLALLVLLETLAPAERLAFVLHDLFAMPFDEISSIVGRTPEAARQLASRARRRVQGAAPVDVDRVAERRVVDAFLTAARGGDVHALLAVLDPDVVVRSDKVAARGGPLVARGAEEMAKRVVRGGARAAQAALVDGAVGVVIAPRGKLFMVLRFTIVEGRITEIDAVAEPERLAKLTLAVLP